MHSSNAFGPYNINANSGFAGRILRLLCSGAATLAAACGNGSPPSPMVMDVDTAVIGEVLPNPSFVIGQNDASGVTFTNVASVLRLTDGGIVVANKFAPPSLHFLSSTGDHLRSVGREGEGPGEFKAITWVKEDSAGAVVVYDPSLSRITSYTPGGDLLQVVQVGARLLSSTAGYQLVGLLPDGSGLAEPRFIFPPFADGGGRSELPLLRIDLTTGKSTELLRVPGADYRPLRGTQKSTGVMFGKISAIELIGSRLLVATGDELGAIEYNPDGDVARTYSTSSRSRSVTEEDLDAEFDRLIQSLSADLRALARQEIRQLRDQIPVAEHFPAAGAYSFDAPGRSILIDSVGRVWVLEYVAPRDLRARWALFGQGGDFIGKVEVPSNFWIMQVSGNVAIGVYVDGDGVHSVRGYEISWSTRIAEQ